MQKKQIQFIRISFTQNGIIAAVPSLLTWLISIPFGWLADWLIKNEKMARGRVRKLMTTIGMLSPAVGLLCLTFIGCNPTGAVILLCFAVMFSGKINLCIFFSNFFPVKLSLVFFSTNFPCSFISTSILNLETEA